MPLRPTHAIPLLCLVLIAGCGDDRVDARRPAARGKAHDRTSESARSDSATGPSSKSGISTFADTPELEACMTKAGFADDAPSTGSIKSWRHPSGARVAVSSSPDETIGIASELGTAEAPADVDGVLVLSGPQEQRDSAARCLG